MNYTRNCPSCDSKIEYTNKRSLYGANKRNAKCRSCYTAEMKKTISKKLENGEQWGGPRNYEKEKTIDKPFKRECPRCDSEMNYISQEGLDAAIQRNTMCNSCATIHHKKTFKDVMTEEGIKQMRATKAGFSSWEEYVEKYPKKQFYKREVWKYTYRNNLESLPNFDKRGRCGIDGAYQIDHIVSINEGWEKGIPAEEIGDISNLQMLPWKENLTKGS